MSWYFQGMENFKVTAIRNGLVKILATIFIFILIKKPSDVVLYAFIYVLATLIGNLTMIPYLKDEIIFIKFNFKKIRKHIRGILGLFLPVIAIQLYTVLNRVMLGALSSSDQVSYFSQIMTVINLALSIISAFVGVLTPHIANVYSEGKEFEIRNLSRLAINFVYLLGLPMLVGCLVCGDLFVPTFFGIQYKPAVPILHILSLLFVILGFGQILGGFLISTNRQKKYTIATIAAESISTIVQVYYLHDLLNMLDFMKGLLRYGLISIIAIVPISIVILTLPLNNIITLVSILLCSVIFYFVILIVIKDKVFIYMLNPLINKFRRR